jgi:hypothetical protein
MFSNSYVQARQRFLKAAQAVKADFQAHAIPSQGAQKEELTIDVATVGAKNPETVILLTSGLHGIEGYLGSAIQTAWLEELEKNPLSFNKTAVVLVHAINPYGFSWQRRVNENNVDLNRNFILPNQTFSSSPLPLQKSSWLQKPVDPDNKFFIIEFFMLWVILNYGFPAARNALIHGQFDYPLGLFWGGHQPETSSQILKENVDAWTRQARNVIHLDFHSGIGKYAHCHLLNFEPQESPVTKWLKSHFGTEINHPGASLIRGGEVSGIMVQWVAHHFKTHNKNYACLIAEYGSHSILRAFKALYQENRFFHHPGEEYEAAKKELLEIFCPASVIWREECLTNGLLQISKALKASEKFW